MTFLCINDVLQKARRMSSDLTPDGLNGFIMDSMDFPLPEPRSCKLPWPVRISIDNPASKMPSAADFAGKIIFSISKIRSKVGCVCLMVLSDDLNQRAELPFYKAPMDDHSGMCFSKNIICGRQVQ